MSYVGTYPLWQLLSQRGAQLCFDFKLANEPNTEFWVENMELYEESRHRVYAHHTCDGSLERCHSYDSYVLGRF